MSAAAWSPRVWRWLVALAGLAALIVAINVAVTLIMGEAGGVALPVSPAPRTAPGARATSPAHAFPLQTPEPPVVGTARLRFGVVTQSGTFSADELIRVSDQVGESPSVVMAYVPFGTPAPLSGLARVRQRGATPLITWEPWVPGGGANQPAFSLVRIVAGKYDSYLKQWGKDLAAWGMPVMLRFGHEMNGSWYPWGNGVNGNQAGDYIRAWQHVHDVVRGAGASNVAWVWTPNIEEPGLTADMGRFYPGTGYVDVIGLDGYNWGTVPRGSWETPQQLFGADLDRLRSLAPGKPILIAETASAEAGGSKSQWISTLVSYLAAQRDVTGFVWFDINKERDWRIDSSPQSVAAFKQALVNRR